MCWRFVPTRVSLPALICPLCQAQMLDIQILLRLFLFRLQQVGTHDRLTISCYGFSFYSLFLKTLLHTHATRKPLFWLRRLQTLSLSFRVAWRNTNRHTVFCKCAQRFLAFGRRKETTRVLKHSLLFTSGLSFMCSPLAVSHCGQPSPYPLIMCVCLRGCVRKYF